MPAPTSITRTLSNTYRQLARETQNTGRTANVSKIAIYDATGRLIAFALFDGQVQRVGFVESFPTTRFQLAELQAGEELRESKLRTADSVPRINPDFDGSLPRQESADYVEVDGSVSIETRVPITDEAFDPSNGKPETKQVGLIVMIQPLDRSFISQISRLTDTEINIFTPRGFSSGSISTYRKPDWNQPPADAKQPPPGLLLNEITIQGVGYYQGLIPLYAGETLAGSIATLHSKASVEKNTSEMIRILWLITAATLACVIPIALYFATSISRPLTVLSRIFRGVAGDGRGSSTLAHASELLDKEKLRHGEMGDLTRSFIAMHETVNQKILQINEINASLENTIAERTAALVAKEQESRTLIENSPDSIARYDRECRRIYANPAFLAMTGFSLDELLGKRPSENPSGVNAETYEAKIRETLASGVKTQFELKWAGKDGTEICSHIRLTPEVDMAGDVISVLAIGRDISDRLAFEAMIWTQANFDTLTNLPNRRCSMTDFSMKPSSRNAPDMPWP